MWNYVVPVAIAGLLILMVIGVRRVESLPKITKEDVADAWLRFHGWVLRTHQAILEWLDPELSHRRARREHEEGARRADEEAHAHTGPH